MSVGGRIIEKRPFMPDDESIPSITRFWIVDRNGDELFVYAKGFHMSTTHGPQIGDEIWWQGGKIYFDQDRQWLEKFGASGPAIEAETGAALNGAAS